MNNNVKRDWEWADRFIPQVKSLLGGCLIETADLRLDTQEATDLRILKGQSITIGCRIRRYKNPRNRMIYFDKYPDEFTIRSCRDSGSETEYSKIMKGFCDVLFYGHADETEQFVKHWYIIQMHSFRKHITDGKINIPTDMPNGDGTHFKAFPLNMFPANPPILLNCSFQDGRFGSPNEFYLPETQSVQKIERSGEQQETERDRLVREIHDIHDAIPAIREIHELAPMLTTFLKRQIPPKQMNFFQK